MGMEQGFTRDLGNENISGPLLSPNDVNLDRAIQICQISSSFWTPGSNLKTDDV